MKFTRVIRSATATWAAVLITGLVAFFLTPYILQRLGNEGYGLWVLVVSLTDHYLFLGVGLRSSVVRYVARHLALGDQENVNRVVASGFYCLSAVCVFVIGTSVAIAPYVPKFFAVRAEYVSTVTALFLLAGLATSLDFPLSIFEGTLESVGRFDQLYGVRILGQALRAGLIVIALVRGWGLLGVGAATIAGTLIPRLLVVPLSKLEIPRLSLHPRWIHRGTLRAMFGYGAVSFSIGLGERLKTSLYPLVIAKFLTASAVTLFAIPMKILQMPLGGIGNMTEYVNPMSSHLDAQGSRDKLRSVFITSVQGSYLLLAPLAAALFVFGKDLISLWVGNDYAVTYPILVILTVGLGVNAAQSSAQSMLFGIGRHKGLIGYRIAEGLSILILSIPLIRLWGVVGFALATTIPLVVINCFLIPRHLGRMLELSLVRYLIEACLLPTMLVAPMSLVLWSLHRRFAFHTWKSLTVASIIGALVYFATLVASSSPRLPRSFAKLRVEVLEIARAKISAQLCARHGARTRVASDASCKEVRIAP